MLLLLPGALQGLVGSALCTPTTRKVVCSFPKTKRQLIFNKYLFVGALECKKSLVMAAGCLLISAGGQSASSLLQQGTSTAQLAEEHATVTP